MKRLSKTEAKYRKKFIAEYHYNKEEQRIFDSAVECYDGYKCVYKKVKSKFKPFFVLAIEVLRLSY